MLYIKRLFNSIIPVLKYMFLSYFVIFISFLIYGIIGDSNVEYFVNNYATYILVIFNVIYMVYLIKKYHINYRKSSTIVPLFMLGIGFSCFSNMIILFVRTNEVVPIDICLLFFSSVIVGPLVEEIIFRYLLIGELSKFNNKLITILLGSFIFAIMHTGLINIIYAFALGIILSVIYIKNRNLTSSIIVHSSANLMTLFLTGYSEYILLLGFILLVISTFIVKRDYLLK